MRLSCPNCGAQYEVPDEVIPVAGRDVQCSNCGDTWFQKHKDAPDDEAEVADSSDDFDQNSAEGASDVPAQDQSWDVSADETTDQSSETLEREVPEVAGQSGEADQIFATDREEEPQEIPDIDHEVSEQTQDSHARQTLDPEVSNVLREEAALESAARASEGSNGLESQPELGLDEPQGDGETGAARRAQEARVRMARMRGEPALPHLTVSGVGENRGPDGAVVGSRRDLLPDIEEINSTLRSTKDRRAASDAQDPASPESLPQQRRRRGFRRGFLMMLLFAAVLILAYVYAPLISTKIPQVAATMSAYVEKVNAMRVWLDSQLSGVLVWVDMKAVDGTQGSGT